MSELTDQVVRDLQDRLGHGGFCCSLTAEQNRLTGRATNAEFRCKVPWKECTVRVSVPQKGWIGVRITVYQAEYKWTPPNDKRGTPARRKPILEWGYEHSMHDPSFNPNMIATNLAKAIIRIKHFFKAHKTAINGYWLPDDPRTWIPKRPLALMDLNADMAHILGRLGQATTS